MGFLKKWDHPLNWQDSHLAAILQKWAKTQGTQFNIYSELCSHVMNGHMTGTLNDLEQIASGAYQVTGFGPAKYSALGKFLEYYRETELLAPAPNPTYWPE